MARKSKQPKNQAIKQEDQPLEAKLKAWQGENAQATLTEIETFIDNELNQVRRQLVEKAVIEVKEDEATNCAKCGEQMTKNGKRKRSLQIKGGETVNFSRTQRRCNKCGHTVFPPG